MRVHPCLSVEGRVAIVTGSGRGIGRALAIGFAEAGARVVVNCSGHPEEAEETVGEIEERNGQAILVQADVSDKESVEQMIEQTVEAFGGLHILVNSAGINIRGSAEDYHLEDWHRVLSVDLTGVFLCCQAAAKKVMIPQAYGRIVNISSISAEYCQSGIEQCAYHACKGGVNMLTRGLALEWVEYGITVNALSPGFIRTQLVNRLFEANPGSLEIALNDTPMRRLGEPEELVGAALFLSSDATSFMTGQNVIVDGGYVSW